MHDIDQLHPVTASPAAAFDLLLGRLEPLPLREMISEREWNRRLLGTALSHLRSLGLVEVLPGAEPARFAVTPWARERSRAVLGALASTSRANWTSDERERLRPGIDGILDQQAGRILVYASDGTERLDLDFKGYCSVIGSPGWLLPDCAPRLVEVTAQTLERIRILLTDVARAEGLLPPGRETAARPGKEPALVFEQRPGGHLRFRPAEEGTGRPLRGGAPTGRARESDGTPRRGDGWHGAGEGEPGLQPNIAVSGQDDEERRGKIAERIRTVFGTELREWQVRATPGINAIDLFPRGHDKALARDHLLTTGPGGRGRQVVSLGDSLGGNDAPLFTRPLPDSSCRYLFLSVAEDEEPLRTGISRGLPPPELCLGHLGTGSRRTERFLNRLLVLRRKGMSHVAALVRSLQEEQQTQMGFINQEAAQRIGKTWDPDRPVTLAFDIDGTLNDGEGTLPSGMIPELLWELDRWGFQLAVITGKTIDRLRRSGVLGLRHGNPNGGGTSVPGETS